MRREKTFFAVTSLGKERWYWVVWPSLEVLQSGASAQHVADGYERTKAEAVDRTLEVAGMDGEWMAANRSRRQSRRVPGPAGRLRMGLAPVPVYFLKAHAPRSSRRFARRPPPHRWANSIRSRSGTSSGCLHGREREQRMVETHDWMSLDGAFRNGRIQKYDRGGI
jgi:hypothetical protein